MSWGTIIGEEKILPSMGGNANEVRLESGKPKKIRLLLPNGEQPYSYFEHMIEVNQADGAGKITTTFRTIRCPKTTETPFAYCPLCDGQILKRRVRNASNVWDYELNQVQKLNQGENVWKPIATTRKMGVDVLGVDWGILKTGTDRNSTEYSATNLGPSPFVLPDGTQLFDIKSEYAPHTVEEMKQIVEATGLKWEDVITPPSLQYPATLQEALDHIMPNGKYKDQSFKQLWDTDPSPKGMINFLATKSDRITKEKSCAQVIMVNLGGANIPGVPKYINGVLPPGFAQSQPSTPAPAPAPAPAPTTGTYGNTQSSGFAQSQPNTPATHTQGQVQMQQPSTPVVNAPATGTAPAPISGDRQTKINDINKLMSTKEKFVKGGFNAIVETLKSASGGKTNIADFTDAELDAMLKICNE